MTFRFRATLLLLASALSLPALSAPAYRVEMILVAYENEADIDQELWPVTLTDAGSTVPGSQRTGQRWWQMPTQYQNLYTALWAGYAFGKPPAAGMASGGGTFTPTNNLTMSADAKRIDEQRDMKVVWHQAWIEPIQEADSGTPHNINIRVKDRLDIQITGTVELHRSRYLHISTDLAVQHYRTRSASELRALTLPDNQPASLPGETSAYDSTQPTLVPVRAAQVRMSRRMRSNELHYLDHPMLGLLVIAVPVDDK